MEDENPLPPPAPLPDFDIIATALSTLQTEIPGLRNTEPSQQAAEIRQIFTSIQTSIQDLNLRFAALEGRYTSQENAIIRLQNGQRQLSFPAAPLLPLRSPQTGNVIPNCPGTVADINTLSAAQATRLLQILQVPIPRRVEDKREAVRRQVL